MLAVLSALPLTRAFQVACRAVAIRIARKTGDVILPPTAKKLYQLGGVHPGFYLAGTAAPNSRKVFSQLATFPSQQSATTNSIRSLTVSRSTE